MEENHIYGGSPAKDLTGKIPSQFKEVTISEKYEKMLRYYHECNSPDSIKIILDESEIKNDNISYFNVSDRTYTKRLMSEEIEFMKFLLPTRAKFIPKK